jgi:small subunit ribosomal protein S17
MADVQAENRGVRKKRKGSVVSRSGIKSVVVLVEQRRRHPVYSKVVRHTTKFHAHDESNSAKVGDVVQIEECRPMSRLKRWRVVTILGSSTKKLD